MPSGTQSDDIHSILSRFTTWAGKHPGNAQPNAIAGEGVREISCEEAMRHLRSRRAAQTPKPPLPEEAAEDHGPEAAIEPSPVVPAPDEKLAATPPAAPDRKPVPTRIGKPSAARSRNKAAAERAPKAAPSFVESALSAIAPNKSPVRRTVARAKPKTSPTRQRQKAPQPEDFRQMLARNIDGKAPARAHQTNAQERTQRVSVRLSAAEEHLLQQEAAEAGVTVSEYLRLRALPPHPAHAKRPPIVAGSRNSMEAQASPPEPQPVRTGLGDWLALLRHRFLASPARFAERA